MANLRESIETIEGDIGENVIAMVVGKHDKAPWGAPANPDENVLLSREAGLAKIDQDYYNGYGGADCYPFFAWTENWIIFVQEYDGATSVGRIPRHPAPCEPGFQ